MAHEEMMNEFSYNMSTVLYNNGTYLKGNVTQMEFLSLLYQN